MATTDNSLETRTPPFLPVTRDGLVDRVADSLAEAILAGRMAPGDRIAESTIARQMDLSRAPVREALRRLESSGLVDYKTNRGFFVHAITGESLANLYELRIVIETAAVARLVRTNAGAALPGLQAQLDELRRLAEVGADMATHVSADMEFHRMICAASGNPRFLQVFDQIANETRLGILVIGRLYDDQTVLAETHEPIMRAIEARDAETAAAAIAHHIGYARDQVAKLFDSNQEGTYR